MVFGAVLRKSQCIMHISNVCRAASCPFLTGPFLRLVLPRGLWPLPGIDEALKTMWFDIPSAGSATHPDLRCNNTRLSQGRCMAKVREVDACPLWARKVCSILLCCAWLLLCVLLRVFVLRTTQMLRGCSGASRCIFRSSCRCFQEWTDAFANLDVAVCPYPPGCLQQMPQQELCMGLWSRGRCPGIPVGMGSGVQEVGLPPPAHPSQSQKVPVGSTGAPCKPRGAHPTLPACSASMSSHTEGAQRQRDSALAQ